MNFEGKSVLLVEQDADIALLMTHILESAGCDVHPSTPSACLSDIANYRPGVILLDQRTCCSSIDAMCSLLNDIHSAKVPVILTSTANNLHKIAGDCHADDFVEKPFDINDLERKVLYWLALNDSTAYN